MRRAWILLLALSSAEGLAGCAAAPPAPPPPGPLDPLRERSNALPAFHWLAELTDGRIVARVELGWKGPDRAFLRYGPTYAIYYVGGVGHFYTRQGYLRFDAKAELDRLRAAYPGVAIGPEPEPVFTLTQWEQLAFGRGLRVALGLAPPRVRLGWLAEFAAWRHEDGAWRRPGLEARLDEQGFLSRVTVGERAGLEGKSLLLGDAVDDDLFEPPSREGLGDLSAATRDDLARALEEDFFRWALETDDGDAVLDALARGAIARRYEPAKMLTVLSDGLAQAEATWKAENPGAGLDALREKLELDKGKALSSVDVMEAEIQQGFERMLDRAFRAMQPVPPQARMAEVAARLKDAVARQVDAQIRKPFRQVLGK